MTNDHGGTDNVTRDNAAMVRALLDALAQAQGELEEIVISDFDQSQLGTIDHLFQLIGEAFCASWYLADGLDA